MFNVLNLSDVGRIGLNHDEDNGDDLDDLIAHMWDLSQHDRHDQSVYRFFFFNFFVAFKFCPSPLENPTIIQYLDFLLLVVLFNQALLVGEKIISFDRSRRYTQKILWMNDLLMNQQETKGQLM